MGCLHHPILPGNATSDHPRTRLTEVKPEPPQGEEAIAADAATEAEQAFASGEDDIELTEEILEEGLCKDDIYATWLKNQYYAGHVAPKTQAGTEFDGNTNPGGKRNRHLYSKGSRANRSRRGAAESRDMAALHYAANRFVGEITDYYGGIPLVAHPRVEFWIRYFKTQGRASFLKWLVRGESVHQVVAPLLREQGLPE